jgi:hypothetical protein
MNEWSNIEVSAEDPEIKRINRFRDLLGEIPDNILQIRKLISGFEICHFKYQQHIRYIRTSITKLEALTDPDSIGQSHLRQGGNAWEKDPSGRSLQGFQYVLALTDWLGDPADADAGHQDPELTQRISGWIGKKEPEKERLARLLVARLRWDWESYEQLLRDNEMKDLEYQVCRIDVCHYHFPRNIDEVIRGIGKLKPVKGFEGCGSLNQEMKKTIEKDIAQMAGSPEAASSHETPGKSEAYRKWLMACFVKTLKEQAGLSFILGDVMSLPEE